MGIQRWFTHMYYAKRSTLLLLVLTLAIAGVYFMQHVPEETGKKNPRKNKYSEQELQFQVREGQKVAFDEREMMEKDFYKVGPMMNRVPVSLTQVAKCPACFGSDICREMLEGDFGVHIPEDPADPAASKGVYFGRWAGRFVALKRLGSDANFKQFDDYVCRDVGKKPGCDVASAILEPGSFVQQKAALSPDNLVKTWKVAHSRPENIPFTACLTPRLISDLSTLMDNDRDGQLSADERAIFYTSLILNPESVMLRFVDTLSSFDSHLFHYFPTLFGACGRLTVAEHGGQPLDTYSGQPFGARVDVAIQCLSLAKRLWSASDKYSMVFVDFHFDNLYVTKNGMLYIVDAEDIVIIDQEAYPRDDKDLTTICNQECFDDFKARLFNTDKYPRKKACRDAPDVALHVMYSVACRNILSDLEEHKESEGRKNKGLLHGLPRDEEELIADALRQCVEESAPGNRLKAVDTLFETLSHYAEGNPFAFADEYEFEDPSGDENSEEEKQYEEDGHLKQEQSANKDS